MLHNKVDCPLCKLEMTAKIVPSNNQYGESNIWYCEKCPGMLIEYWDRNDTDALLKFLDEKSW